MSKKDLLEKKAYIFDVDGTLYCQRQMRIKMFVRLMCYYVSHLKSIKELIAIYYFRKLREKEKYRSFSIDKLSEIVADCLSISVDTVSSAIQKWMFEVPLEIIHECSYLEVVSFAKSLYKAGKKIIIYSDYPAKAKISVLEMPYDYIFISGEEGLQELKPSMFAMKHILHSTKLSPDEILYIGDRDKKDGASAELVDIAYCDIQHLRKIIMD